MLEPSVLALDIYHSSRRNSLPLYFPSVCDHWFGEGFLRGCPRRGQAQGLLGPVDPEPVVEVAAAHGDVGTAEHGSEDQAYPVGEPWVST